MLRWPHSLFPQFHQDENLIVFILTFLNSMGFPLPGEPILFGAGFILGKKGILPGGPIAAGITACVLAGEIAFWLGRRFGHSHFRKIHWLHLTPEKFEWMEQFFKRYGAKMVFIARFIALIPPPMPNLLAGMAEMRWRVFIFYNLAGSVVYVTGYILLGYLFGKQWNLLESWLGPSEIYLILQGIALIVLAIFFRRFIYNLWAKLFFVKPK